MRSGQSKFDEVADRWDRNPEHVALAEAVSKAIREHVPLKPYMRVIDYGTGTGLLALGLHPWVGAITAADTSSKMLKVLQTKLKQSGIRTVRPLLVDLGSDAIPSQMYDLVVSSMTLHHIRDIEMIIGRFHDVLRPKGWIAIADLDAEDGTFHSESAEVEHFGFSRRELANIVRKEGFGSVHTYDAHKVEKVTADGKKKTFSMFLLTAHKG